MSSFSQPLGAGIRKRFPMLFVSHAPESACFPEPALEPEGLFRRLSEGCVVQDFFPLWLPDVGSPW